jgi:hypothetical protein
MLTRPSQRRVARIAAAGIIATAMVAATAGIALATVSTTVTITAVSPHLVSSGVANKVITVTGTGFDQSTMTGVVLSGSGACTTDPDFIVVSPTSLVLKTKSTDCAVGASTITITDASGTATNTAAGAAAALSFTALPTLVTVSGSVNAMTTDNTSGLLYADQVTTAPIGGGTFVRVTAGAVPFANTTAAPLSATFAGVALTSITMPAGGAYFVGKLGAHAAAATPSLVVTSNAATATFATAAVNGFAYAGSTTSILPTSGPANGGTVITITGVGFSGSSTVSVGGVAATAVVATGTTKLVATVPKITAGSNSGPVSVIVTTGAVVTVLSPLSVYTYLS